MNCSQIYIGLEFAVKETESEIFSIELISDSDAEFQLLNKIFKQPYIYYLAPHSGCGCGWEVMNTDTEYDELSKQSLNELGLFVGSVCLNQTIHVLTCNQSAVGFAPELQIETNAKDFIVNLENLRPKFGENQAMLYKVKA
ncbi:hypothetical protein GCM10009133_40010 [Cocleimonas flava]|uniref:Uncharacterized protein n=1 Tax=Cocleimonas flava TaxID=634765 RepID=A0A4R1ERR4_9GAMM|nr:hypothetical protein [Cocleimonas flava]TCJ81788.1 hypothetical protein EV695_4068 [Cocleimonas flava]